MIYKVDNKDNWLLISEKLFSLMKHPTTTSTHLFGVETDGTGQHYINLDLGTLCPVYLNANSEDKLKEIGDLIGLSVEERATLKDYIMKNNPIELSKIIPTILQEYKPIYK
jgi:hypothetical protein